MRWRKRREQRVVAMFEWWTAAQSTLSSGLLGALCRRHRRNQGRDPRAGAVTVAGRCWGVRALRGRMRVVVVRSEAEMRAVFACGELCTAGPASAPAVRAILRFAHLSLVASLRSSGQDDSLDRVYAAGGGGERRADRHKSFRMARRGQGGHRARRPLHRRGGSACRIAARCG